MDPLEVVICWSKEAELSLFVPNKPFYSWNMTKLDDDDFFEQITAPIWFKCIQSNSSLLLQHLNKVIINSISGFSAVKSLSNGSDYAQWVFGQFGKHWAMLSVSALLTSPHCSVQLQGQWAPTTSQMVL